MNSQLSSDKNNIHNLLQQTLQVATRYFEKQGTLPPGRLIADIEQRDLPITGIGAAKTIQLFEEAYADKIANSAGPSYFGFVTGGSTPAAVAGDWLVSTYDQNAAGSNDSVAPHIERQTIHFIKQLLGYDAGYFGSFVTGATMSNFLNLAVARQWVGEQRGIDFSNDGMTATPVQVLSATAHSSIFKSLSMLGIGRKNLIKLKTLPGREAADVADLEKHLGIINGPVIVVANAGTVNTVDFDDLAAIGALKKKYNFWMHVDAAFGGFAGCSDLYKHYVTGINHADSITVDAHKWMNVPYDGAMQFTRHKEIQSKVFQNQAAYLGPVGEEFFHYTPENSRRFRALPAWFTLMAYGHDGHREIVERNCTLAALLGERITHSRYFKLLAPVRMNVVCFTLQQKDLSMATIQQFLNNVRDDGRAFFTPTMYQGEPAIRAAVSNWLTTEKEIETAFCALEEVYQLFAAPQPVSN